MARGEGKKKPIKQKVEEGGRTIPAGNRINTLLTKNVQGESYRNSSFLGFSVAYAVTIT